jgi:hypothetical protein
LPTHPDAVIWASASGSGAKTARSIPGGLSVWARPSLVNLSSPYLRRGLIWEIAPAVSGRPCSYAPVAAATICAKAA